MNRKKKTRRPVEIVVKPLPDDVRRMVERIRGEAESAAYDTPDGILRSAVRECLGQADPDRYRAFVQTLMKRLSLLASGGRKDDIFEYDFDSFFTMVVRSINSCGEMLEMLRELGVDYVPPWADGDGGDDEDGDRHGQDD